MKLYRYRPISELLFKELLYSEVYLASPKELNDPLDLSGQLNFFSESEDEIKALVNFLFIQTISSFGVDLVRDLMDLMSYESLGSFILADFSGRNNDIVTKNDLFEILSKFYKKMLSLEG